MDMSGISKGRIQKRIEALKTELTNLNTLIAQYQAAIGELQQLLEDEPKAEEPATVEYIEASE